MARLIALALVLASGVASAHFQLLLPAGELALQRPAKKTLYLPFTHPAVSGQVMDMARPRSLFVVHRGERIDALETLEAARFSSAENTGASWLASHAFKRLGDHVLVLEPEPYFEADEGTYIQQITKTVVNVGGLPTDWDAEIGLAVEIMPLANPAAVWAGSTFTAQVLAGGEPVPGAEVEVELLNYEIDTANDRFQTEPRVEIPVPLLETQSLRADSNGVITLGIPFAGRWGIAALDLLPGSEQDGKPLSVDAVLWLDARSPLATR